MFEEILDWSEKWFGNVGLFLSMYLICLALLIVFVIVFLWETFILPGFFWRWILRREQ
jgi:hypothetical protein